MAGYYERIGQPKITDFPKANERNNREIIERTDKNMEEPMIWQAAVYYLIRLVMFSVVAGAGIAIGIKLRKKKNEKLEAETE